MLVFLLVKIISFRNIMRCNNMLDRQFECFPDHFNAKHGLIFSAPMRRRTPLPDKGCRGYARAAGRKA